ncbi:hypothetical protein [Aeromicrobium sp. CF3.5]|uniref:hypothetical protein n=1 Tax=Aeromicrobium sp. CF3.5 TaxID=3373078 RepID=UPI003EE74901
MVRAALASAAALLFVLTLAGAAVALEQPAPPVLFPDDPELQQAYEDGFGTGYSVGSDDGFSTGRREAREQASLRDDVTGEVRDDPVEGGRDLGAEIEPTPAPSPTTTVQQTDDPDPTGSAAAPTVIDRTADDDGIDIPWWPIAFAVAATAWFVTRRARPDDD